MKALSESSIYSPPAISQRLQPPFSPSHHWTQSPMLPSSRPAPAAAFSPLADPSIAICSSPPFISTSSFQTTLSTCTQNAAAPILHAASSMKCPTKTSSPGLLFSLDTLTPANTSSAFSYFLQCFHTMFQMITGLLRFSVPVLGSEMADMENRNHITWNSMIAGFLQGGRSRLSLELFVRMRRFSVEYDRATLISAISSCSSIHECHQFHSFCIKSYFASEAEVSTALVKVYSSLGGGFQDCYDVFSAVTKHDILSWTGIITACCEKEPTEAVFLFCQLRQEGIKPDQHVFSVVVKACANFATERNCMVLHVIILKSGYGNNTVLCNALIHAYARCGNYKLAACIFDQMEFHDKVSWNSIIKAYAVHGKGKEALNAFQCMDVPPDSATFVGILTACSHCGYVNEGHKIFKDMSEVYGIEPQLDHFACMVDIFARAGKLLEAEELINQMPIEPDPVVWTALLGASRKHGETNIGRKAAQKLMELEPSNSVGYVMMSNIYCATKSFGDAAFVRKGMKECGVKKEPGLSWIEVGDHVHEFSVGGHRHPSREKIFVELKRLLIKLKEMGYVADTRIVLHEIDEVHKEEHLLHHSEKMALVFGLMNASSNCASLKIMKNIRICEDCHRFIKWTSKYTGREIVVRDSNRFHHFTDGACSCGDYW